MKEVKSYCEYLKAGRKNFKPEGFDFDVNQFENLIDCWTEESQIPVILDCSVSTLDKFCKLVYGMGYHQTYQILSGITDAYMRKTIKNLSSGGNSTALNIVTEHFMKLKKDEENKAINIKIVNDLQDD